MNDDEASIPRLVAALREGPTEPAVYGVERDRLRARLAASIGSLAAGHPGEASNPNPTHGAGLHPALRVATVRIASAWLAPAFVAGALAGAATNHVYSTHTGAPKSDQHAVVSGPPPREVSTPAASERAEASAVVRAPAAAPSSFTPPVSRGATSAASAQASPRDRNGTLAAEQRLLDAARAALASGNPEAGLGPLRQHGSRFPGGALAEEREALWVRLLVATGRDAEARAHAATFHQRFPSSLFARVVDSALATIPRRNDGGAPKP